jgi:ankyrin repeat protein
MASEANERVCRAAMGGDVAGIAAALLAGADANAFDGTRDWTPLLWAAYEGHATAIAALLAAGARVDGVDSIGNTPLMWAAICGRRAAIDALLAAGADVNHANPSDHRALHVAFRDGHLDAARVLLDAGARTDLRDKDGQRPIDMVRALTPLLDATARSLVAAALPRRHAQVCKYVRDKSAVPAFRALFASAAPWSRRRPVAVACYAVEWEWEA